MANKLYNPKDIKETDEESISKYNEANGTKFLLFDPRDITEFKCKKGIKDGKIVYLCERFQIMFGNHELWEYCFFENDTFDKNILVGAKQALVDDVPILYTYKKGLFSRRYYNAYFNIDGIDYYVYLKSCNESKFKEIMYEFIKDKLY